ncbi:MAG: RtcB family protein, partial [Promicromonosporaceae bacterium]|nr:RtcB family protein [Promicromonosporaceae bacterium]
MQRLGKKLFSWASILDDAARKQALVTSEMPFVQPHMALMPDAHVGLGATVGSVIPTEGAIMPAAVGVDIGCGMVAVLTQWTTGQVRAAGDLSKLRVAIERAIPLSAGNYNHKILPTAEPRIALLEAKAHDDGVNPDQYHSGKWRFQLGTLGSGNHFIEITRDELDRVWLFLHSGSRGIGNLMAQHHIKVAKAQMDKFWITLPDPALAYLVEGTDEFDAYIRDLHWAQEFALLNREEMMERVETCISEFMGAPVERSEVINCHHNFTQKEHHFGRELWISRKGAISAQVGE